MEEPMTLSDDHRSDLIAACPLFSGIGAHGLAALAKVATDVSFPAGHVIARQGEIGTGFFVVADGSVKVVRDGSVLAHLGRGDFFGELSVLDGRPRNAMVTAETATTCVAIASWDFEAALLANPAVTLAILRGVATRLREATDAPRH
jgi:CRP-like cAMP-binding protein